MIVGQLDIVYSEKKKTKYVKSELRLIETLDGICDRILAYNIHKVFGRPCHQLGRNVFPSFQERKDSTRFAKGQSETFSTLEGLVAKGVKVSLKFAMICWKQTNQSQTSRCVSWNIHLCVFRSGCCTVHGCWSDPAFSLIVVIFNESLLVLQVDIGIPHELWDKPSAEVKHKRVLLFRDSESIYLI